LTRVLIPSGALGLGYDKAALERGIAAGPDIIAIDGGSTDSGPYYLGTGTSKYSRTSTKLEWQGLMEARRKAGVPLVIGTAGTCGADSAVDWLLEITKEIAAETGESLKIALLKCGKDAADLVTAFQENRLSPLEAAPEISADIIAGCTNIVALAGAEQILIALNTGADIVIAGRTTDTAIISALPIARGEDVGAAWHGAKVGECGALCATDPQTGVVLIDFDKSGFTVTPMAASSKATPETVSAHMLYENSDPFILYEPGGYLDVSEAKYTAVDDHSVRVTGSKWVPDERYCVKLEGAMVAGYRVVSLALLRDPRYVENAENWCADIIQKCRSKVANRLGLNPEDFEIELRIIGKNATLGTLEPSNTQAPELGVLGIVTAQTEALAMEIAKMLNPYLLHHPLTPEEEQPTFAFPFSPPEMNIHKLYVFCMHHVLQLADPMEAFRLEVVEV